MKDCDALPMSWTVIPFTVDSGLIPAAENRSGTACCSFAGRRARKRSSVEGSGTRGETPAAPGFSQPGGCCDVIAQELGLHSPPGRCAFVSRELVPEIQGEFLQPVRKRAKPRLRQHCVCTILPGTLVARLPGGSECARAERRQVKW